MSTQDCAFFARTSDLDVEDFDSLYADHLESCQHCGRRVYANTTPAVRQALRTLTWRMFAPLALAEATVTFAVATVVTPLSPAMLLAGVLTTVVGVAAFIAAHHAVMVQLVMNRYVAPVMSHRLFQTGVERLSPPDRLERQRHAVIKYLRFGRGVGWACICCYNCVGAVFGALNGSWSILYVTALLSLAWAKLVRVRLGTVRVIELFDAERRDRAWLYEVQSSRSLMHRLLSATEPLRAADDIHTLILSLVGGAVAVAAIGERNDAWPVALASVAVAALALWWFQSWRRGLAGGDMNSRVVKALVTSVGWRTDADDRLPRI